MKRILFLCAGNSCRSQMAEGFLRYLAGDSFDVFSAGIMPIGVNSSSIAVMKEVGVNIASQSSKSIKCFLDQQFDYAITLCNDTKEVCPVFPGKCNKLHWGLDDPAQANTGGEERVIILRRIRDQIRNHIELFLKKK